MGKIAIVTDSNSGITQAPVSYTHLRIINRGK